MFLTTNPMILRLMQTNKILLFIGIMFSGLLWPTYSENGIITHEPMVLTCLSADIMTMRFGNEVWIYRLCENGAIRKIETQIENPRPSSIVVPDDNPDGKQDEG